MGLFFFFVFVFFPEHDSTGGMHFKSTSVPQGSEVFCGISDEARLEATKTLKHTEETWRRQHAARCYILARILSACVAWDR